MSNLVDYSNWTEGTGSITNWLASGTNPTYENVRLLASDPWNKETVVWQIRSADNTGYAGGFYSIAVNVDTDYDYRFSVYVNRLGAVGERTLFGCNAYNGGSITNLNYIVSGTTTNNPYFHYWYNSSYLNEWLLLVGFIRKSSTLYTDSRYDQSGVWRLNGQKIENALYEYRFATESYTYTGTRMRLFYYDSADKWPTFVENAVYPRIEKLDGTELPFNWLLRGPNSFGVGVNGLVFQVKNWH